MNAEELLAEIEELGVAVTLERDGVLLRPGSRLTPELIDALRSCKGELRELIELRAWPESSRESVRSFGVPHARLYPFIGRTVATPDGPGTLLQVFSERATVQFDGREDRRVAHFLPSELAPPSVAAGRISLVEGPVH